MRTVAKRVLVTGGAGFLGSHLCERLLAQGHDVLCVDNYFTGRKDNIAHLLSEPLFEAMRHDVTHPLFVEVDEITLDRKIRRIFTGWMFADSPGLNAVEHPVYDVWLQSCKTSSDVPPPDTAAKQ